MINDPEKEQAWRELLELFETETLPINEFCALHNVKAHQFYYWRNKFKRQREETKDETPAFIKLSPIELPTSSNPEMSLKINNVKINVPLDFNVRHLRKLLEVVMTLD